MNLSDISVLNGANYRCIISGIKKTEAINVMQNIDLMGKKAENYKT